MNLHAKLLASLLGTALIPLVLMACFTYVGSRATLMRNAEEALVFDARTLGTRVVSTLTDASEEVHSWSRLETLQAVFTGDDVDLRMGLLLRDLQETSNFLEIWCLDSSGRLVAASDFDKVGQTQNQNAGVRAALSGSPFISDLIAYPVQDGAAAWTVEISQPILGAFDDETIIGAVVAFYDWETILDLLKNQTLAHEERNQEVLLLDPDYLVLAATHREAILKLTVDLSNSIVEGLATQYSEIEHVRAEDGTRMIRGLSRAVDAELGLSFVAMATIEQDVVLESLRDIEILFMLSGLAAAIAVVVVSLVLSRKISWPIARLSVAARRIAAGELDVRPEHQSADEIGRLASDLDAMRGNLKGQIDSLDAAVKERTQELEMTIGKLRREIHEREEAERTADVREQQLVQADKMVSLGILVSGVAHEINNPNGLIGLNLPILSETWEKALPVLEEYYKENGDFSLGPMNYSEMREHMPKILAQMQQSSNRIRTIVSDLKGFSRKGPGNDHTRVDINKVVESASALVRKHVDKATDDFSINYGKNLPAVRGDVQRLEQVVVNLLLNAADALTRRDAEIRVKTTVSQEGNAVQIRVTDEGRGISSEDLPHVADPFFTTRRASGGTGLGLSVSTGIVDQHHGTLTFESEVGKGTLAVLSLPVARDTEGSSE